MQNKMTLTRNIEPILMRNYGRIIQNVVRYATTITNPTEQQAITIYIAQCMAQKILVWNREQEVGVQRVINDIRTLSNGQLNTDFPELIAALQRTIPQQTIPMGNNNKNKKKKK